MSYHTYGTVFVSLSFCGYILCIYFPLSTDTIIIRASTTIHLQITEVTTIDDFLINLPFVRISFISPTENSRCLWHQASGKCFGRLKFVIAIARFVCVVIRTFARKCVQPVGCSFRSDGIELRRRCGKSYFRGDRDAPLSIFYWLRLADWLPLIIDSRRIVVDGSH